MKVFSFNSKLYKVTGVEKVLMDVHHAIQDIYDAKIVGTINFKMIDRNHGIQREEYIKFQNPWMFYNSIVVLHERKFLLLFWILNHLFFQKIRLIYVHHNTLYGLKPMSIFPTHIVAISESGITNLTDYFGVPREHIHKIYNCVKDHYLGEHPYRQGEKVRVLLPARINSVKQQLEIVAHLKECLSDKVQILFAGDGPDYEKLKETTATDERFICLGFRNDVHDLLHQCDYMMLFSKHEGLPISLIEACMLGTPVVCNNVGGNNEIVHDRENGFIVNNWDELGEKLNTLVHIEESYYREMSKAGRKIYLRNFTFDHFKANYIELLQSIQNE